MNRKNKELKNNKYSKYSNRKLKKKITYKSYLKKKFYSNIYNIYINKLISQFLKRGNKERSIKLLFKLKYIIKNKSRKEPIFILFFSLLKGLFKFYFIRKRLGSSIKEIPMPLSKTRQIGKMTKLLFRLSKSKNKRLVNLVSISNLIINTFRRKGMLIRHNNKHYRKALENRVLLFLIRR